MQIGKPSDSVNVDLYLCNCGDHSVRVRTEFRALSHKSTKETSEDIVESQHAFQ